MSTIVPNTSCTHTFSTRTLSSHDEDGMHPAANNESSGQEGTDDDIPIVDHGFHQNDGLQQGPDINPDRDDDNDDDGDDPDDDLDSSNASEMDNPELQHYTGLLNYLAEQWLLLELNHQVSKVASEEFWRLATSFIPQLFALKELQGVLRPTPQFAHLRRVLKRNKVPPITLDFAFKNKDTGEITVVENESSCPSARFPNTTHSKIYEIASIKVFLYFTL